MSAEIIARPHPLRSDAVRAVVPPGSTLAQLLGDAPETVHAQVNGEPWPRERWHEPLPEGLVSVHATPQDGALRAVAMIAVAVVAAYTGGLAAGAMGFASGTAGYAAASAAVAGAVTVAGSLAVNALIPPKMPDAPDPGAANSTVRASITGTRNRANPYGVIPRAYGAPRWFPPLAANPFTEVAGNSQYLRMLVCLGYGPLEIAGHRVGPGYSLLSNADVGDAIRIGDANIGLYDDVNWQIGMPDQLTLSVPRLAEESVGAALNPNRNYDNDVWVADNVSATRTTAPNTREISLDLTFPQGVYCINDNGTNSKTEVEFRIEYRPAGGGSWTTIANRLTVTGTRKQTYRLNRRWSVAQGQYEVRVTRLRSYHGGIQAVATDCTWTSLRSIQDGQAYTGDHVLMVLRIRATDQLNGVIEQLNLRTQSVLRVWDGAAFSDQATSNPAWAYLDTLTGPQVGRPIDDGKIDLDGIKDWADWCDAEGLSYHWVHDQAETLFARARAVAAGGQASFSLQDGLFGVVRDDPQAPVVQVLSPRNAMGFESSRQYKALPHALRVKYIDPDTWTDAERLVYRDGFDATNATLFEDFETQGVASADEAWHHGRYHFRQAILRPETFSVQMDWENLAMVRGNRVRLAYDTILVGLGWGRVKAITAGDITLDECVLIDITKTSGIRVRRQDGSQATVGVSAAGSGRTDTLALDEPLANVVPGDLVLFGELGKESIDCKVTRIEPGSDLSADVTLVDAATDIYDLGTPPAYDPGITQPTPIEQFRPTAPVIDALLSDGTTLVLRDDGTFAPGIRVTYTESSGGVAVDQVEIRASADGGESWQRLSVPSGRNHARLEAELAGGQMTVQMRARSIYGVWGNWGGSAYITPVGAEGVPRAVTGLTLAAVGDQAVLTWDAARDIDVLHGGHVQIYHAPSTEASLSSAVPMTRFAGSATEGSVPLLAGTYFAVFQDAGGRASPEPTRVTTTAPRINRLNVAETLAEGPVFPGKPDAGAAVIDGMVKLDSRSTIDDQLDTIDSWESIDALGGIAASGSYRPADTIDLGAVYTARLTAAITSNAYLVAELIDNRAEVDTWLDVDGVTELVGPRARLWVRTTPDDPGGAPEWSDWASFTMGDYSARAYQFRMDLAVDDPGHQIAVSHLEVSVDMPDRVESNNDVAIPAGGATIPFAAPFWAVPAIGITAESLAPGERVTYSKTSSDFTVQILDDAGAGVARTIDWIAKSYGYQESP